LVFTDWRQLPTTTDAFQASGLVWRGLVPWDKTECARPRMGGYAGQCEYVVWGSAGPLASDPSKTCCGPGLVRLSVFGEQKHHIAGKPVGLFDQLLKPMGHAPAVLDPFMGSGPVGLSTLKRGGRYVGIELARAAFEIACRRLEEQVAQGDLFGPLAAPEQAVMCLEAAA
jgi:site-specific DNA-methyltransferase (adenine-specific)